MAVIDPASDTLVIRIVYDGAPFAGKTTSIRALAAGLHGTVHSPGEIDGRTLYFDWLDYTGGLFEGHRIRCQIVSVPGQALLAPRRRRILRSADVVVYVSDSTPSAFSGELGNLHGLKNVLARDDGSPIGVIVQANKRDVPGAMPLAALRKVVDESGIKAAIVESNASLGTGIREIFVLAVRLALDRVREQLNTARLITQRPEIDTDIELLADLKRATPGLESLADETRLTHIRLFDVANTARTKAPESSELGLPIVAVHGQAIVARPVSLASEVLTQILGETVQAPQVPSVRIDLTEGQIESAITPYGLKSTIPPLLPDDKAPSGLIWPLVVGRTILSELTDQVCVLERLPDGAWTGLSGGRWRLRSHSLANYSDVENGRQEMVRWARVHVGLARVLSPDRSVVLSADHQKTTRLWQVVRIQPSMRGFVERTLMASTASLSLMLLASVIAFRCIESEFVRAGLNASLTLDDVSVRDGSAWFIGDLMTSTDDRPVKQDRHEAASCVAIDSVLRFSENLLRSRSLALLDRLEQPSLFPRPQQMKSNGIDLTIYTYVRQASAELVAAAKDELWAYLQQINQR